MREKFCFFASLFHFTTKNPETVQEIADIYCFDALLQQLHKDFI